VVPSFDAEALARDAEIGARAAPVGGGGLERECLAALGSERARLVVAVSAEELKRFAFDQTTGFLLSLLDGATSLEDVLDIAGVPRLVALQHLRNLMERGVIASASDARRTNRTE
jgi:hypothetical protein